MDYSDESIRIEKVCDDPNFYKAQIQNIRRVLSRSSKINLEVWKKFLSGIWKEYGIYCLNILVNIDFDIDIDSKNAKYVPMEEIVGPLVNIKIFGKNVFNDLLNYYEEKGQFDVDWKNKYEIAVKKLQKKTKEIKILRSHPIFKAQAIQSIYDSIGKIKKVPEAEAVDKYCQNEEDQNKCLKILNEIKEGRTKVEDRKHCRYDDPLLLTIRKAIVANDCPCTKVLSQGCCLTSDCPMDSHSLFYYACKNSATECALFLLKEGGGIDQKFENGKTPISESLLAGNEEISIFLILHKCIQTRLKNKSIAPLTSESATQLKHILELLVTFLYPILIKNKI